MRVLILSQYYKPEPIPKPSDLAETLAGRGHVVSVVTGFPNYPAGRLYAGYRLGLLRRMRLDGVQVLRAFEVPYHGRSTLGRLLNYGSFMLASPAAMLLAPPCDVIYVWHPPLTVGLSAWVVARLRRVPFVYDVQDIWPDSVVLAGMLPAGGWSVRLLGALERFIYGAASHLLVNSEGARQNLLSKGVPASHLSVMKPWLDPALLEAPSPEDTQRIRSEMGWDGHFVVMYAGNIGMVQGLDTLVTAATRLTAVDTTRFVIVGDGSDRVRLQEVARSSGANALLQFVEHQPRSRMPAILGAADALLVPLRRSETSRGVIPTKILAYLAAARPVLVAMEGEAAALIESAGAGVVAAPEDPDALLAAIGELRAMSDEQRREMGLRGRRYVEDHFSKESSVAEHEAIFERVIREGRGTPDAGRQ